MTGPSDLVYSAVQARSPASPPAFSQTRWARSVVQVGILHYLSDQCDTMTVSVHLESSRIRLCSCFASRHRHSDAQGASPCSWRAAAVYAVEDSVWPDNKNVLRGRETGEGFHSWHPLRSWSGNDEAGLSSSCQLEHWWCHVYPNAGLQGFSQIQKEVGRRL